MMLPMKEWRKIKRAIGKPRLFCEKFIKEERNKLNLYRNIVRNYLQDKVKYLKSIKDSISDWKRN